jgi:predicted SnoaL-like aldol condensation-catalyzing enzyme
MAGIAACTNETDVATESASTETSPAASAPAQSSPPPLLAEPVVGVADPEALFVDDDPLYHRNKQTTLHIMRELLQCNQWDRAGEWLTNEYHQHNPNAASGLEGVVYFFTQVFKVQRVDECGELTTEIVAVMADDDYVTVLWPRTYPDPRDARNAACLGAPPGTACAGQMYSTSWFDTWRFVDGKADEHWDPATIAPPTPAQ